MAHALRGHPADREFLSRNGHPYESRILKRQPVAGTTRSVHVRLLMPVLICRVSCSASTDSAGSGNASALPIRLRSPACGSDRGGRRAIGTWAAVYAASEGLDAGIKTSARGRGSSKIENYLDFLPVRRQELATRAINQAQKFGQMMVAHDGAPSLQSASLPDRTRQRAETDDSVDRYSNGAQYNKPSIPGLEIRGGVCTGATNMEAQLCEGGSHCGRRRKLGGPGCGVPDRLCEKGPHISSLSTPPTRCRATLSSASKLIRKLACTCIPKSRLRARRT